MSHDRAVQDYFILHFGSVLFKIGRLLMIALLCVHFFACAFYRIKKLSAFSDDDVTTFYESKNVDQEVSSAPKMLAIFWNSYA